MKNLCQLQFVCYFMPYFMNDDESHFVPRNPQRGWIRAGEVCTLRELIWYWIEGRVFSIYTLILGEKTKWNPSQPSGPPLWLALENEAWSCNKRSAAQPPHPRSALFLKRPTWRFDESFFSRCLTMSIFSVCVSMCFSLRTLTLSCGISVESKKNCLIQPLSLNVAERRCMYV